MFQHHAIVQLFRLFPTSPRPSPCLEPITARPGNLSCDPQHPISSLFKSELAFRSLPCHSCISDFSLDMARTYSEYPSETHGNTRHRVNSCCKRDNFATQGRLLWK